MKKEVCGKEEFVEKKLKNFLISKNGKINGKKMKIIEHLKLKNVEKTSNFQHRIKRQKEKKIKIFNMFFHRLWKNKIQNKSIVFVISSLSHKFIADAVDFILEGAVLRHFVFDHVNGSENRRMVTPKYFRRVLKRNVSYASNDINRYMPWQGDFVGSLFSLDVFHRYVVSF